MMSQDGVHDRRGRRPFRWIPRPADQKAEPWLRILTPAAFGFPRWVARAKWVGARIPYGGGCCL